MYFFFSSNYLFINLCKRLVLLIIRKPIPNFTNRHGKESKEYPFKKMTSFLCETKNLNPAMFYFFLSPPFWLFTFSLTMQDCNLGFTHWNQPTFAPAMMIDEALRSLMLYHNIAKKWIKWYFPITLIYLYASQVCLCIVIIL